MIFTSGLEAASSTSPESFSTRPTIEFALSSMTSTRSISRFVFSTEVLTSRSNGIVSSRIASIVIFVLSSTRNVFSSTKRRPPTRISPADGQDDHRDVAAGEGQNRHLRCSLGLGRVR